jgi:hypothetical protein
VRQGRQLRKLQQQLRLLKVDPQAEVLQLLQL